VFFNLKHPT
jgi:hypothetical protein